MRLGLWMEGARCCDELRKTGPFHKSPQPLHKASTRVFHMVSPHILPGFVVWPVRRCTQGCFRSEGRGGVLDVSSSTA